MSGHIFFADKYYGFDDALYTSIRLLSLLAKNVNLEKFISSLPKTFVSPEMKLYCSDKIKFTIIDNISKNALEDYRPENITTIDGVRAKNNFGWWLIRASNTEEALIIRFEGKSVEDKKELFLEVQKRLKKEGFTLEFN